MALLHVEIEKTTNFHLESRGCLMMKLILIFVSHCRCPLSPKALKFKEKGHFLIHFNYWVYLLVNRAMMIKLSNQRSSQKKFAALFLAEIKLPGLYDKLSSFSHDSLIVMSKNSNFNINIRRTSFMCEFYLQINLHYCDKARKKVN